MCAQKVIYSMNKMLELLARLLKMKVISMKKRKNYKKWVHCSWTPLRANLDIKTTCGKKTRALRVVKLNDVTCPRCLEILKMNFWYCDTCGFIDGRNVTDEECCEICGAKL